MDIKHHQFKCNTYSTVIIIRHFTLFTLMFPLVIAPKPICQYNEDCPPNKLCDRLNRICINPCNEDSCGDNALCVPENHGIKCACLSGFVGNPYTECELGNTLRIIYS